MATRAGTDADAVFRALADASRRALLDRLHADNGQTLNELCAPLDMSRQAVTKHLLLLEEAGLVVTVRRGREKFHYLNPVPLHEIYERWIWKFQRDHLRALADLKRRLEGDADVQADFVYVTYIDTTPEKLWDALMDGEMTRLFWGRHRNVSDWKPGSTWAHQDYEDPNVVDIVGKVVECERPRRLVLTWADPARAGDEACHSRVTFEIEPSFDSVKLTVIHDRLENDPEMLAGITQGWPAVLSSLKTLLETGRPLAATTRRWGV